MPSSPESEDAATGGEKESEEFSIRPAALRTSSLNFPRSLLVHLLMLAGMLFLFAGLGAASNGMTLSKQPRDPMSIPRWLYLATGAGVIGASALLASVVTDREYIHGVHTWSGPELSVDHWWRPLVWLGRGVGVIALALAVYLGFTGPQLPTASFTILVTFVVVRAGLPMVTYLGGNLWPALNPWRTLLMWLPTGFIEYPRRFHRWPAVGGLLLLVWIEVILPVSALPRVLASMIVIYTVLTLAGGMLFGPEAWFKNADPLAVLFDFFGSIAPVQRRTDGLTITLPGSIPPDRDVFTNTSDVAFVVFLIWELTYSGFITTETGAGTIEALVGMTDVGVLGLQARAIVVYTGLLIAGFAVFFGAYWSASLLSRRYTGTYVTARQIAFRFAGPLLAIAAGYHLAHYVELVVSLSPALLMVASAPLSPPANPLTLAPPGWFDGLNIAFVLVGHVVGIWAAHATAFEVFASRLVAIRSQYPFIAVMIGYTVLSLWILSLPGATPPFLL